SEEHVFPEAIGGTLKIARVCKPCNNFLGANVDVLLTDHTLILIKRVLIKRAELGMSISAGKVVDPLRKMFAIGSLASDPEKRIRLVPDPSTGQLVPRIMYHSTPTQWDDGTQAVLITLDESEVGQ